jgi:O-antigen/teichoic acid export membrane protein
MAKVDPTHSHLDPTAEITLESVKERAVKGVVILTGRTFFLQVLSFAAWFFLSVLLDAPEIGVFFIVSAVVNFLRYFADIGLAAALIQKKEEINEEDLRTTFTIQQFLVIVLMLLLFAAVPYLARIYNLNTDGTLLVYALGVSFLLSSLKTIPSVLLERELNFGKLVIPDVLENIVYNGVAVTLAYFGFGVASFAYAVLLRGMVGLVAIYTIRPWLPGIAFSKRSLKKLLSFGVPYQVNTFLATIKDDGLTAVLGGILGPAGLGYLAWAQKWAQTPLRLFMDNVLKVTFPAFSRMQDDKDHLATSVTRSIFFVCFLVFPSIVGLVLLAPVLVEVIPRYDKWTPALIPLALVSVNVIFAAATTQLTNLLNAIGRIKTTFKLMVMWTVLTWAFVPYLAINYGVNGAALGYMLVGSSSVIAIYIAGRYVAFSVTDGALKPLFASAVMGAALYLVRYMLPYNVHAVWILIATGIIVYMLVSYYLYGVSILSDAKKSFKTLFNR